MANEPTIRDLVRSRSDLQALLIDLLEQGFLLPGIFHYEAYLRDEDKIVSAWKADKSRLNAIALGVSLYNDFYGELVNHVLRGNEPKASEGVRRKLQRWTKTIAKLFPDEQEEITEACGLLGQYLEFMNRTSQGY